MPYYDGCMTHNDGGMVYYGCMAYNGGCMIQNDGYMIYTYEYMKYNDGYDIERLIFGIE